MYKSHALHSPPTSEYPVMKVKSMIMAALGSIKDELAAIRRGSFSCRRVDLSSVEIAVLRSTDSSDSPSDVKYVHEILFITSNEPGSITILARRISGRLESASRDPVVALKTLLLLRGGDHYFEDDLRNLWSSGDLRIELSWISRDHPDPLLGFVLNYSRFLEERMEWLINQAGKLEPIKPVSSSGVLSYDEKTTESILYRLSKCQALTDRIVECLPVINSRSSHAMQSVMTVILRESFRVYESFSEGVEVVFSSYIDLKKHTKVLALDILRKACIQTSNLKEFYDKCRKCVVSKNLDYPSVRIITSDEISSLERFEPKESLTSEQERKAQICETSKNPFSLGLETKISTVWVEFDDDEGSESSSFSFDSLTVAKGESSKESWKSMDLL